MSKNRIEEIDILKGIAMILVVIGHYFHPPIVSYAIWSFHMPLFVIISGYFVKEEPWSKLFLRIKKIQD